MKLYISLVAVAVILSFTTTIHAQDFYIHENGVTIVCDAAEVGDTWEYFGVTYTKRTKDQITPNNASTTCTSGITSMRLLFFNEALFNENISHWDVSSVTTMDRLFVGAHNFNQPIDNWDVSSVTNMTYMFSNAQAFNQDISKWNVGNVTNMNRMFNGAQAFNQDISSWSVSNVTDMGMMFYNANEFNQDLGNWDVSNVMDMSTMFHGTSFNQDISNWDVSNVTDMSHMFRNTPFNKPIGNWDVSSVRNMDYMFLLANIFNQDIVAWNVSNVLTMKGMFNGAQAFNQNISSWCVSNINEQPQDFRNNSSLEDEHIPRWGTCPTAPKKITLAYPLNQSDSIDVDDNLKWNKDSKATSYQLQMFNAVGSTILDSTITDTTFNLANTVLPETKYLWKVKGLADIEIDSWSDLWSFTTSAPPLSYGKNIVMNGDFSQGDTNWTIQGSLGDILFQDSVVVTMAGIGEPYGLRMTQIFTNEQLSEFWEHDKWALTFEARSDLDEKELYVYLGENGGGWSGYFSSDRISNSALVTIPLDKDEFEIKADINDVKSSIALSFYFAADYSGLVLDNVKLRPLVDSTMFSDQFYLSSNGVTITCDDAENGKIGVINGINYVKRKRSEITPENASRTCTSGITDITYLFENQSTFNEDISHWDISSVTKMTGIFHKAFEFNQPLNYWDVSNVTDLDSVFMYAIAFDQDLSNWSTTNVNSLNKTFFHARAFNNNISTWDVSNVTSMENTFAAAFKFNTAIEDWDVSNVQNMNGMFTSAIAFNQPLNNWNTESLNFAPYLFRSTNFNQPLNNWKVDSIAAFNQMFKDNTVFNQDLSNWDLSNATSLASMFSGAEAFDQDLSSWNVSNVTNMLGMFSGAITFNQDLSNWCVKNIKSKPNNFDQNTTNWDKPKPEWGRCIQAPTPFDLIYPVDKTIVKLDSVVFNWESSNDPYSDVAVTYDLYLASEAEEVVYKVGLDTLFGISGLLENETYYWKVIASNTTATKENNGGYKSFKINYSNQAPTIPRLITPTDSSVEITTKPYFEWAKSADIDNDSLSYVLHVESTMAANDQFGFVTDPIVEPNFSSTIELADNHHFAWYVAVSDGDTTIYSEPFTFWVNTELEPPSPFELISPAPNEQLTTTRPTFNWNKSIDNDPNDYAKYTLVVSKDSLFTDVVLEQNTSIDTTYTPEVDMLNNAKYYWKVIATDTDSLVTQSKTLAFILGDLSVSNEGESELPQEYTLSQNYPNPFNPSTQIQYALPEATQVTLEVFNSVGQKVMELVNRQQSAGYHAATFDASGLSSGVYLYKLTTPSFTETKKMLLIK